VAEAKRTTYTETYFGRLRRLPDILSRETAKVRKAERQVFNTAIQGSIADCMKIAASKIPEYMDLGVKYKVGVFDSLLLQVPLNMGPDIYVPIFDKLSDFGEFKLRYKCSEGMSWKECQLKA
jgi:DNA polymerase-1